MKREIIFLDEDKAIDYSNASKKDTSSIIAEVRKLKVNKEMKSFTKENGISGVKYEIKLKNNDVITIAVPKIDHYNQMLLTAPLKKRFPGYLPDSIPVMPQSLQLPLLKIPVQSNLRRKNVHNVYLTSDALRW